MTFDDAVEVPMNLGDVPDLTGLTEDRPEPWQDGWYTGTILANRSFTNKAGMDVTFNTEDVPSRNGDSRNINLQVQLTRKSDGRTMNTRTNVNYRLDDFTKETIAAVLERKQAIKDKKAEDWGPLFRSFMSLLRIGSLQRIAGVRQFERRQDGSLDISPLVGKSCYIRISDDEEGKYKEVKEISDAAPKKGTF